MIYKPDSTRQRRQNKSVSKHNNRTKGFWASNQDQKQPKQQKQPKPLISKSFSSEALNVTIVYTYWQRVIQLKCARTANEEATRNSMVYDNSNLHSF